jgi:hypothetical protein
VWGVFFLGLLGGFTAWVATEYFARPLAGFFAMRARAAEVLARYENRQHSGQHSVAADADWLAERKLAYVDCGAELVAFAIVLVSHTVSSGAPRQRQREAPDQATVNRHDFRIFDFGIVARFGPGR